MLHFAGHAFEPLPSGGLYWPERDTLLVADLHFEKLASFAAHGQLLPPYDTGLTLARLEADLSVTKASRLVALGDSFHRPNANSLLTITDQMRLDSITQSVECIWLLGNHDPTPYEGVGGVCLPALEVDGLTLTHEPKRGVAGLIAGHLHPAAHIRMGGRSTRRPCFVHDGRLLILPAYGASTGALNILSPAFAGLFHWPALEVTMLGRAQTYRVSARRLIA